jgi:predicted nucleic acid-binding protein
MEKRILVDTDIIIKSYRGDSNKYNQLRAIEKKFSVSIVTALELLNGSKNMKQLISTRRELKLYSIIHFDNEISKLALQLFSKYAVQRTLRLPDSLIAATALHFELELYTDNKKDYDFIEGVKFYKEK